MKILIAKHSKNKSIKIAFLSILCFLLISCITPATPIPTLTSPPPTPSPIPPTITPYPTVTPPVFVNVDNTGSVTGIIILKNGICCAGGIVGETIPIPADFTATSDQAGITHMRVKVGGGRCATDNDMRLVQWELFARTKTFEASLPIGWAGYYVSVQFLDAEGHASPTVCDDISLEGMPASVTPTS